MYMSNLKEVSRITFEPEGWIFKIKVANPDQYNTLMSLDQYLEFLNK